MNASSERGQTLVVTVVFLVSLLAMAVAVLDVGAWYREDRAAQAAADAAALAGAQELPGDPAAAMTRAAEYAEENGGDIAAASVSSGAVADDTITVTVERPARTFFAPLFGIGDGAVSATAVARASGVSQAKYAAPVVVSWYQDLMPGAKGCKVEDRCDPVFGVETELELINLKKPGSSDGAGAFGLINLRRGGTGTVGADELARWLEKGFDQYMPLGTYYSVPSAMFNSSQFRDAMRIRQGDDLLFPIYDKLVKSGSNAEYRIVGWVGFTVTDFTGGGDSGKVRGKFTRVIWQGIRTASGGPANGVKTISLVG